MSSHSVEYLEYIASPRWKRRKLLYYAKYEKVCGACKSVQNIHLHHHTYARLGYEHDEDLVPLCELCHDEVHRLHKLSGRSKSLTAMTEAFILDLGGSFHPLRRRQKPERKKYRDRSKKKKTTSKKKKTTTPMIFSVGTRVRAVPAEAALKRGSVRSGILVEKVNASTWRMEMDDLPGSRVMVTTTRMVPWPLPTSEREGGGEREGTHQEKKIF